MVWMINTPEQEVWLFGEDWLNKDKKPPTMNERGERLALWMKDGPKASSKDLALRVEEHKRVLSDDPKYLKGLVTQMLTDLDITVETMDLNEMVHTEFQAQEHYRQTIRGGLLHLVQKFRDFCHEDLARQHAPKTPAQQYQHGRCTGRYEAFAMCAQYVQDIIDQAAMNVAKDKQKELEEDKGESNEEVETNGRTSGSDTDVSDS